METKTAAPNIPCETPEHPIRRARKRRGLTQEQLALEVEGLSQGYLSKIENYSIPPNREVIQALYQFFDGKLSIKSITDYHYVVTDPLKGNAL